MRTNWPELTEFSTCCSLRTGIYIVAVFQLLCFVSRSYFDISEIEFWSYVLKRREATSYTTCNAAHTIIDLEEKHKLILQIVNQHVVGILFRLVSIGSIFALIYGMYSSRPTLIRIFLKINIPLCVINTLQLALNVYFYDLAWKILMVFSALMDAYQLVAVRSMYKVLTGKSMIHKESGITCSSQYNISNTNSGEEHTNYATVDHSTVELNGSTLVNNVDAFNNAPVGNSASINHSNGRCEICNNMLNSEGRTEAPSPENPSTTTSEERLNPPRYDEVATLKELNLKEGPTIFDPDQLVPRRHPLIEESTTAVRSGRPSSLDIRFSEKKQDPDPAPVIYDQDQLNMGFSPIIEDRALL